MDVDVRDIVIAVGQFQQPDAPGLGVPHLHVPDLGVEAELVAGHYVPADRRVARGGEPVVLSPSRRASADLSRRR